MIYEQALSELMRKENIANGAIYLENNYFLSATLPSEINKVTINYVSGFALSKLKGTLTMYRVIPAYIEQGQLKVTIVRLRVKRKGRQIDFVTSGGVDLFYAYDCNTNNYRLSKVD
ncbi:hypothetical protein [Hymenobacter sp. B81]|uniref:hypothetical protein n=1 Tax=Hymenobacter sp. B81 TaxID=3344878 RepID=UPI0037DD4534